MARPTEPVYHELQHAYDAFNRGLFGGVLPPCLITLQPGSRSYGFFPEHRWDNETGEMADEIALNPAQLAELPVQDVLSALAHDMTHLWQYHFGKPSRAGYHNREWADKMLDIGLQASHTGAPGGKRTGQRMSHYPVADGAFDQVSRSLLAEGLTFSWRIPAEPVAAPRQGRRKTASRCKYTCLVCGLNAWAKPNIRLYCGTCELELLVVA